MSNKPLTEGSSRHVEKVKTNLAPISPPPSAKPSKKCCGGTCHTKDPLNNVRPKRTTQANCLKDGGCDGEPLELKCIHYDAIFAAFVMVSIASGVFGLGLGMTLFAIGTSASFGFTIMGIVSMALGAIGSVALWSTLSDGIKVYKKIMKETT